MYFQKYKIEGVRFGECLPCSKLVETIEELSESGTMPLSFYHTPPEFKLKKSHPKEKLRQLYKQGSECQIVSDDRAGI